MNVTQEACYAAFFRLFKAHGVVRVYDQIAFNRLEEDWKRRIGLRRSDLLNATNELILSGMLVKRDTAEGPALELTGRGALLMRRYLRPLIDFRWLNPFASLIEAINAAAVLRRARLRTLLRVDGTPRSKAERRQMAVVEQRLAVKPEAPRSSQGA